MADEDTEVFEITDFTTASEWERFIARLEEVIHEWKITNQPVKPPLVKDEIANGVWEEESEDVNFADFQCNIIHRYLKQGETMAESTDVDTEQEVQTERGDEDILPTVMQDLVNMGNDFPPRAHCLSRWYGLRDFLIINPMSSSDAILSESRCKILLSSICIALNNTGCHLPMFVQVHQRWRKLYYGIAEAPGVRTHFDMVHLKTVPRSCNNLAGLLDVFKGKIATNSSSVPPVTVTVRFTYVAQDWNQTQWPQLPPDLENGVGADFECSDYSVLPFGVCEDPVSELHLAASWPLLSEDLVVDNDVYSDLDPIQAPEWYVRVRMNDDLQCLLSEYLLHFTKICYRKETTDELLGYLYDEESDISHALEKLTDPEIPVPIPKLSKVVNSARLRIRRQVSDDAPLAADLLNHLLEFLFPDASNPYKSGEGADAEEIENKDEQDMAKEMFKFFTTAPSRSLTFRLATCFCHINRSYGELKAVAQLWQEFILELRYRWENNFILPDVDKCAPNLGYCLLHQKLQMLNCCIVKKQTREKDSQPVIKLVRQPGSKVTLTSSASCNSIRGRVIASGTSVDSSGSYMSDDDDEFFECVESQSDFVLEENDNQEKMDISDLSLTVVDGSNQSVGEMHKETEPNQNAKQKIDNAGGGLLEDLQPEGRLRVNGDLKLLGKNEAMYIPVTQEPTPLTEDMLEEQAEVLARLGTSSVGAHLRARMQSTCLLSDMEAFKAANPGCTLEDFVRWYSPRDYDEQEGKLSERMQLHGNLWQETWAMAKSIPVRRQKRLFDDTKEAEKVLHYLESLKPAQVALLLLPVLIHAALLRISQLEECNVPTLQSFLRDIAHRASKIIRRPTQDIRKYQDLIKHISLAETSIARVQALKTRLLGRERSEQPNAEMENFVSMLLDQPEVPVPGAAKSHTGRIIEHMFREAQKNSQNVALDDNPHPSGSSSFPPPAAKEYILRVQVPRPAPYSRVTPQRMYCVLLNEEFRLAGAFTEDTMFQ